MRQVVATFLSAVKAGLAHPLTRGLAIDHPQTTERRRRIIAGKPALRAIYREWYGRLCAQLPPGPGAVLELGTGAGFLKQLLPEVITSEVLPIGGVDVVCDGRRLPFAGASLRAIVMVDVLHHLPDVAPFLADAERTLRPGGRLLLVEPWPTPFSRRVYRHLHHEPFVMDAPDWPFPAHGPLSSANGALPWMVFARDRERFNRSFPKLTIREIRPFMPVRYLLSAGVDRRLGAPAWLDAMARQVEGDLPGFIDLAAMFACIVVERHDGRAQAAMPAAKPPRRMRILP